LTLVNVGQLLSILGRPVWIVFPKFPNLPCCQTFEATLFLIEEIANFGFVKYNLFANNMAHHASH
jgi:hypothetical protein